MKLRPNEVEKRKKKNMRKRNKNQNTWKNKKKRAKKNEKRKKRNNEKERKAYFPWSPSELRDWCLLRKACQTLRSWNKKEVTLTPTF